MSESDWHPHVRRPGGITLLMALGIIQGFVALAAGLFLVLDSDDEALQATSNATSSELTAAGVGSMIGGGLVVLFAVMLGRGSSFVRWAYGIIVMINTAFAVWGLFALHGQQQLTAAFTLVFGVIVLWILFGSERTDRFFEYN